MREFSTVVEVQGREVTLDHIEPDEAGPLPTIFVLHGSDGFSRGGTSYRLIGRTLAEAGYAAVVVHYFEATHTTYADPATTRQMFRTWRDAIKTVVTAVTERDTVDPVRLALVGVSLGAYLCVSLAGAIPGLQAIIEFSGGMPSEQVEKLATAPPILILHGEEDQTVKVAEAYRLQTALQQMDRRYEMHLYPGHGHRLDGEAAEDAMTRCLVFLRRYM